MSGFQRYRSVPILNWYYSFMMTSLVEQLVDPMIVGHFASVSHREDMPCNSYI